MKQWDMFKLRGELRLSRRLPPGLSGKCEQR